MGLHKCATSDGASIFCLCVRGEDHDEEQFDRLVEDDPPTEGAES
jgi:hypothetical protein